MISHFTILVATSGDTGSAVEAAFHGKSNIRVIMMFPKISKRQEKQITCWGDNIQAVEGVFDDCQALVKEAFKTPWWTERTKLNTSNSILVDYYRNLLARQILGSTIYKLVRKQII